VILVLASKEIAKRALFLCGSNLRLLMHACIPPWKAANYRQCLRSRKPQSTSPRRNRPIQSGTTPQGEQAEAVNSGKVMPVLRNSRHEKFALIVAKGETRSEAYREVTGSAKNADANADNWLNTPGVRERIAELQEQTAKECGMEHIDCAKSLVAMYQSALQLEHDSEMRRRFLILKLASYWEMRISGRFPTWLPRR
jgi:hypothetical protein